MSVAEDGNERGDYYWAQYVCPLDNEALANLSYPAEVIKLPEKIGHFEICHTNYNHYNVVLTEDQMFPLVPPYNGTSSSEIMVINNH